MSASASSSGVQRSRKKAAALVPSPTPPPPSLPPGTLPLVPCPCCRVRRTIRLVSQSITNPGRVFYKCPNHRVPPNPCDHYFWEDGEENYVQFLARNGYICSAAVDADLPPEETEDEGEEEVVKKMDDALKKVGDVAKKMDELIEIGRNVFAVLLFAVAIMLYVAVAK